MLLQDTRYNESKTSKQLLVAALIQIFFKNKEFLKPNYTGFLKLHSQFPVEDRKTELADGYLLHLQSLADLTKYQPRICAATASKNMFLPKYNKGDFIFALTFKQWLNIFCSSCTNTRTQSSAGLMGLESRNNPRSIFRKCWNEKSVRSSQLPVSRAALAQSLWCWSELLGMESLP